MKALLLLTNQDSTKYGLSHHPSTSYSQTVFGFADDKARKKAIKMFNDWWSKHTDKPPYKDITPLELPKLAKPGSGANKL